MVNQAILDIVSGTYHYSVTSTCDCCRLCEYLATENFSQLPGLRQYHVSKQPETWEEREQCFEAMERCPRKGIRRVEVQSRSNRM